MRKRIKRYDLQHLSPGMLLANAIAQPGGRVLLTEHTRLTGEMIAGLKQNGILFADVMEEYGDFINHNQTSGFEQFMGHHAAVSHELRSILSRAQSLQVIRSEDVESLVNGQMMKMLNTPGMIEFMQLVRHKDDYTFSHSISVSLLCGLIARWTGRGNNMTEFMVAGLLHDCGKILIPQHVLNKPGKFNEAETRQMQAHCALGWKLCVKSGGFSDAVNAAVLSHHERIDGSGYPHCLTGHSIPYLARVVAIADVYDAMSSNRVYQDAKNPFAVMEEIFEEMFCRLDPDYCFVFLEKVKEYLIGSRIMLDSGEKGKIMFIGGKGSYRAIVQADSGECKWLHSPHTQVIGLA